LGFPEAEVSITLLDDPAIAEIGARFGGAPHPTDVLSFSMLEGPGWAFRGAVFGDVLLSVETAERQALSRGVPLDEELRDLLIHGILHLLGMDHADPADARAMRGLEDHLRWELRRRC
jgi:probable rRNA maturation factor